MIIDCVSDLHGSYPKLEGGDLLIVAGDLTSNDTIPAWKVFFEWLEKQKYKYIVYIGGNHDGFLENCVPNKDDVWKKDREYPNEIHYLMNTGCEIEGLKIWGSPYTPEFCNWHFMKPRGEEMAKMWEQIPDDTDILITHGPPFDILDKAVDGFDMVKCGCEELLKRVLEVKPKLHVFGHIHESYGEIQIGATKFVNCAHMDGEYNPVNKPIRVIL